MGFWLAAQAPTSTPSGYAPFDNAVTLKVLNLFSVNDLNHRQLIAFWDFKTIYVLEFFQNTLPFNPLP